MARKVRQKKRVYKPRSIKINAKAGKISHGPYKDLSREERLKHFNPRSYKSSITDKRFKRPSTPTALPDGNIFIEKHRETLKSKVNVNNNKVHVLRASYEIEYFYYGSVSKKTGWYNKFITSYFILSHNKLNNWLTDQVQAEASNILVDIVDIKLV